MEALHFIYLFTHSLGIHFLNKLYIYFFYLRLVIILYLIYFCLFSVPDFIIIDDVGVL